MITSKHGRDGQFGEPRRTSGSWVKLGDKSAAALTKETIQSSIRAEHTDPDPLKPGTKAGGGRNVFVFLHCSENKGVKVVKVMSLRKNKARQF